MRLHHRKRNVIGLLVLALILYGLEAGIWTRSISSAHSESDKVNIQGSHPPTEIPAIAATLVLLTAAVLASIPLSRGHREAEK
jgi:hypothetical protein